MIVGRAVRASGETHMIPNVAKPPRGIDNSRRWEVRMAFRLARRLHSTLTKQTDRVIQAYEDRADSLRSAIARWKAADKIYRKIVDGNGNNDDLRQWFAEQPETLRGLSNSASIAVGCFEGALHRALEYRPYPVREIANELLALFEEYPDWEYNPADKTLRVTTDDITLTDRNSGLSVDLGSLVIQYSIDAPRTLPSIRAISPVCAYGSPHWHPHVMPGGQLCAGDAHPAILAAASIGAVQQVFEWTFNTINSYNPDSAYAYINAWYGPACDDCGTHGDLYECHSCDGSFCEECGSTCEGCDTFWCDHCIADRGECAACGRQVCSRCESGCQTCDSEGEGKVYCDDCVTTCSGCAHTFCNEHSIECGYTGRRGHATTCHRRTCAECSVECSVCNTVVCPSHRRICTECGKPVCLTHCVVRDGRRICQNCLPEGDDGEDQGILSEEFRLAIERAWSIAT